MDKIMNPIESFGDISVHLVRIIINNDYHASMRLCLVCKYWRRLVLDNIYEIIADNMFGRDHILPDICKVVSNAGYFNYNFNNLQLVGEPIWELDYGDTEEYSFTEFQINMHMRYICTAGYTFDVNNDGAITDIAITFIYYGDIYPGAREFCDNYIQYLFPFLHKEKN